ncbi:hypothetical protein JQ586_28525 [Bradyrhizobium jicamae]|nr:hypothetical protein [Bradyrhizobium jicamae]
MPKLGPVIARLARLLLKEDALAAGAFSASTKFSIYVLESRSPRHRSRDEYGVAMNLRPGTCDHGSSLGFFPGLWARRPTTMPESRLPDWLTTDLVVIVVMLAILGAGVWIAP